jgi:hypothetical protein
METKIKIKLCTLFHVAVRHINDMIKGNDASSYPTVNAPDKKTFSKEKCFCLI